VSTLRQAQGRSFGNRRIKKPLNESGRKETEKVTRLLTQGDVRGDCKDKNPPFVNCERTPKVKVKFSHHLFAEAGTLTPQPLDIFIL
jgi:hypothetical protein